MLEELMQTLIEEVREMKAILRGNNSPMVNTEQACLLMGFGKRGGRKLASLRKNGLIKKFSNSKPIKYDKVELSQVKEKIFSGEITL